MAEEVTGNIASSMGKKVGGLPLGVWIAVLAGGVLLGVYMKNRNAAKNQAQTDQNIAAQQQGLPGVGTGPGDVSGSGGGGGGDSGSVAPTTKPKTNEEWEVMVANGMIAMGYDPQLVDLALRHYLAAQDLTGAEKAVITIALARYGVPPMPLPPPPAPTGGGGTNNPQPTPTPTPTPTPKPVPTPTPKPPPAPAPPPRKAWDDSLTYTVSSGESLGSIAAKYGLTWQQLWDYQFMPGIRSADAVMKLRARGPNLTYAGSTFEIPPKGIVYPGGY